MVFLKKHYLYFLSAFILVAGLGAGFLAFGYKRKPVNFPTAVKKEVIKEEVIRTALLPLFVKAINFEKFNDSAVKNSAALTEVGKNILIINANRFYYFNPTQETLTRLKNIKPPKNNHEAIDKSPSKKSPRYVRYEDIQSIKIKNKMFLLASYGFWDTQNLCMRLKVAKVHLPSNFLSSPIAANNWQEIFQTPCIKKKMNGDELGGRMVLSRKPNHIFLTTGDFKTHNVPLLSSVIEINVENKQYRVVAPGLRNPLGIAMDNQNRLWTSENGPRGGDEINLIEEGKHYGWPFVSYGTNYGKYSFGKAKIVGRHGGKYQKPIFAFVPSIAPSNLTFINNFAPEWDGDLLVAALSGHGLYRLRLDKKRVIYVEKISLPTRKPLRIRYVHNHGNGIILALADPRGSSTSPLFIIRPATEANIVANIGLKIKKASAATQEAWEGCLTCHSLSARATNRAPSLKHILGKKAGTSDWDYYSSALKTSNIKWNKKTLAAFLKDPNKLVPGTTMPKPSLSQKDIKAITKHLRKLKKFNRP